MFRDLVLFHRIDELVAAALEVAVSYQSECSSKFFVYAPHRRIISCVGEVTGDVEGFLYTEPVVLQLVPILLALGYQRPSTNGDHIVLEIEEMTIVPEELIE